MTIPTPTPRYGSELRLEIEWQIAAGKTNSWLMQHYELTYEQVHAIRNGTDLTDLGETEGRAS